MNTDSLIDLLARGAGPAPRHVALRRLAPAAAAGAVLSALLAIALQGAIPASLYGTLVPWMKLAYAGTLALAAGWLTAKLARPAARLARPVWTTAGVVAVMALAGAASLLASEPEARLPALFGHSWQSCPWNVLGLSLPTLALTLALLRGLAPTRLRAAGFAAGLFAGAVGALGYTLSCPESSPAFVAVWYTLGIASCAAVGAWLGPRVLRW
ncbi:MAG: NrsF family protein [Burkholderiaceae bacterium]